MTARGCFQSVAGGLGLAVLSVSMLRCHPEVPRGESRAVVLPASSSLPSPPIVEAPSASSSAAATASAPSADSTGASSIEPALNAPPSAPPASPAPTVGPAKTPQEAFQIWIQASDEKQGAATRVLDRLKPAFRSCRKLALNQIPKDATLQGRIRFVIGVAPSGKVDRLRLPQLEPRRPYFDAAASGAPIPNPNNRNIEDHLLKCMNNQILQARFAASASDWGFIADVQVQ